MKNIAVFSQSLTVDYALEVLRGITSFFDEKDDVRLFITQTRFPSLTDGLFEYQYWSGTEILKSRQIDAIIVISGSYASYLSSEQLRTLFKPFCSKPIISIAVDLEYENSFYTTTSCTDVYKKIVEHLKNKHGCKKIAFMSANLTQSQEAADRFEAFKNALSENQLEYDPDLIFDGRFTTSSARAYMSQRFTSKDQINFDAIVAANDLMALGCENVLMDLGVEIPDEVKIVGFDDTYHARYSSPSLSTVAQQIFKQGYEAAEVAYKILCGKTVERRNNVELLLKFRQSCGCIDKKSKSDEYIDYDGHVCMEEADHYMEKYRRHFEEIFTLYTLFDTIHTAGDLSTLYSSLKFLIEQMDMNYLSIYMYDNPVPIVRGNPFQLPSKANLIMFSDIKNGVGRFEPEISVDINQTFLADQTCDIKNGNFLVSPIFSGKLQYGYVVCNVQKSDFEFYNIYLKIMSNMIVNAYEFTKTYTKNKTLEEQNENLLLSNTDLELRSKTDELTGILNRRGFLEDGQEMIYMSVRMKRSGIVFFADMDGLKTINDTYGHEMGDKAICVQSKVLQQSLRSTDILGRISGDEFAFITDGMQLEVIDSLRKKIDSLCKKLSKENDLPFELSISIGAAVYSNSNLNLMDLLVEADKNLYIAKKQKKNGLNQTEQKISRL